MLRRVLRAGLPLVTVLGVVGLAAPAYAGGIGGLEIDGPRLDRPVHVTWETPRGGRAINDLLQESGRRPAMPVPKSYGAMYTVRVETCIGRVDQVLYPFAEGGPLLYTLPGPVDYPPLSPGWRAAPDELRDIVAKASNGPDSQAAAQPADPVEQAKPEQAGEPHASTPASVAGWLIPLGLVGVGGATLLRRRRQQH